MLKDIYVTYEAREIEARVWKVLTQFIRKGNKNYKKEEEVTKDIQKIFDKKIVNYLDVTFSLNDETYKP